MPKVISSVWPPTLALDGKPYSLHSLHLFPKANHRKFRHLNSRNLNSHKLGPRSLNRLHLGCVPNRGYR